MKRIALLGTLLVGVGAAALIGWAGACGTEAPSAPAKKDLAAPDSVRGDTAYYSYQPRPDTLYGGQALGTMVLSTFHGAWHYRGGGMFRKEQENGWLHVEPDLVLVRASYDGAVVARAAELIRARGDVVVATDGLYVEVRLAAPSVPDSVASAHLLPTSVPLLEWLEFYDQHEDVFSTVYPVTQAELAL